MTDHPSYGTSPAPSLSAPGQKPPVRMVDVVVSVIMMLLGAVVIAGVAFTSLFLSMMSDGCSSGTCNFDLLGVAFYAALFLPPLVYLGAVVWGVVRIVQRRMSWWVPIAGLVGALAVWGVAVGLMVISVGG